VALYLFAAPADQVLKALPGNKRLMSSTAAPAVRIDEYEIKLPSGHRGLLIVWYHVGAPQETEGRSVILLMDEDDRPWSPPEVSSEEVDEWEFLVVECLANRILWDGDHEIGPELVDSDPAVSQSLMNELGIAENYYTAVAPDPTDEQLDSVRRTLRDVCGGLEGLA